MGVTENKRGPGATLVPYVLDAAGDPAVDWARRAGPAGVFSVRDKSLAMLCAGLAGMGGNLVLGVPLLGPDLPSHY